jgi:hypothetical protein
VLISDTLTYSSDREHRTKEEEATVLLYVQGSRGRNQVPIICKNTECYKTADKCMDINKTHSATVLIP